MAKKYLYCPKCRKYPDEILEIYTEPIVETRFWNGEEYEWKDSNINEVEFEQRCKKCGTKLKIIEKYEEKNK